MGDVFHREFSLGQVQTGSVPQAPSQTSLPSVPGLAGSGMSIPDAQLPTPITRPTFLSAFLQNLGPSISGAMQAPRGSGIAGGLGGAFQGIEQQHRYDAETKFRDTQAKLAAENQVRLEKTAEAQRKYDEARTTQLEEESKPITLTSPDGTGSITLPAKYAGTAQAAGWRVAQQAADTQAKINSQETIANQKSADQAKALQVKMDQFKTTDEYRKWKANLDNQTKTNLANLTASKAPAALFSTAEFAKGGLDRLNSAKEIMSRLQASGAMGSLPANKVEDWVFGKGLVDPNLDTQTRKDIGQLRAALGYTSSAAMRAHTGRTSQDIYNDFKSRLGPGQDWSALAGAIDETENMLSGYANAASDENIKALRQGTNAPSKKSSSGISIQRDKNGRIIGIN